ncbi:MAG TPA: Uma2 family endonuclease, partial [Thermoanaerobaculia bacterium]|nr:Uma2 family endonuclease [Thermoanaerobaculia bacterium]
DIDVVEPDLMFISNARMAIITDANAKGSPDLVIEVLSEGTRKYDEMVKMKRYERFGITEYWLVDPYKDVVMIYRHVGGRFEQVRLGDLITTPLLPGFALDTADIFLA